MSEFSDIEAKLGEAQERLNAARAIITDALISAGSKSQHDDDCEARKRRYLPDTHPDKLHRCSCWLGRAAEYLKSEL